MKQTIPTHFKSKRKEVMLSFDIEEFDMPLEYGKAITLEEQIQISYEGTRIILDVLQKHDVKATFFCTVIFAEKANDLIQRLLNEGHELASHGYFHSKFKEEDLLESRRKLELISNQAIVGFRMPRMMPIEPASLLNAGYLYDSSINPTFLPGRYNNFFKPRLLHFSNRLLRLPASVLPLLRVPLFWLSFHHLPLWLYFKLCKLTIHSDGYINIYFHPWEFIDISYSGFSLPSFLTKNSGQKMIHKFNSFIESLKVEGCTFTTISKFLKINTH